MAGQEYCTDNVLYGFFGGGCNLVKSKAKKTGKHTQTVTHLNHNQPIA